MTDLLVEPSLVTPASGVSAAISRTEVCENVRASRFRNDLGLDETWIISETPADFEGSLSETLLYLGEKYDIAINRLGLDEKTVAQTRFFCSDAASQTEAIRASDFWASARNGFAAVVEQAPIGTGGRVAVLSYHIGDRDNAPSITNDFGNSTCPTTEIHLQNYSLLLSSPRLQRYAPTYEQTVDLFVNWAQHLRNNGLSVLANGIRTWIHVADIDAEYAAMVRARERIFTLEGLTPATRFLASTGIEGRCDDSNIHVTLEASALRGVRPEQLHRMTAPGRMSAASNYGVTFERGTTVAFGDRRHLYISGTASIDSAGKVVHPGSAAAQANHALDNVGGLLENAGASLDDLAAITVYLRDDKDFPRVRETILKRIPDSLPIHFTRARVCRPEWLVEIEAIGVKDERAPYPFFA